MVVSLVSGWLGEMLSTTLLFMGLLFTGGVALGVTVLELASVR